MTNITGTQQGQSPSCVLPGVIMCLLSATAIALVLGYVFVASSTGEIGLLRYGGAGYYSDRHLLFAVSGITLAFFAARYFSQLVSGARPLFILAGTWALLLLPLFFEPVAGGYSWVRFGGLAFQPSAFAGPALILFLSVDLAKKREEHGVNAYISPILAVSVTFLLLGLAGRAAAMIVVFSTAFIMAVAGGLRKRDVAGIISLMGATVIVELLRFPYRFSRMAAFYSSPTEGGYQTAVSKSFLASGGLLGNVASINMGKLPEFYSNFGFSGLVADQGWLAALLVVVVLGMILYRAVRIAQRSAARTEKLLAGGIAFYLGLMVLLHLLKCFGIVPPNDIPLPLISYGGSELLSSMFLIGILFGIGKRRIHYAG